MNRVGNSPVRAGASDTVRGAQSSGSSSGDQSITSGRSSGSPSCGRDGKCGATAVAACRRKNSRTGLLLISDLQFRESEKHGLTAYEQLGGEVVRERRAG